MGKRHFTGYDSANLFSHLLLKNLKRGKPSISLGLLLRRALNNQLSSLVQTSSFNKINLTPKPRMTASSKIFSLMKTQKDLYFSSTQDWRARKCALYMGCSKRRWFCPLCPVTGWCFLMLGTPIVHTLAQDLHMIHHQSFLPLRLTAFMFLACQDTLSWSFYQNHTCQSNQIISQIKRPRK